MPTLDLEIKRGILRAALLFGWLVGYHVLQSLVLDEFEDFPIWTLREDLNNALVKPFYWNLFVALSQCDKRIIGWPQKGSKNTLSLAIQ